MSKTARFHRLAMRKGESAIDISCSAFRLGCLNSSKEAGKREQATGNTQFKCITAYSLYQSVKVNVTALNPELHFGLKVKTVKTG